ncbi:FAD-dependent monooxygenase [Hymenobacter sp. DG25A]|uniref:FAD-dependent monooxygenase n=1 Tax=Hymenobacter sp. DG25A TaxID=1385663 RepID=UPI0009EA51B0|nr:FAD-dependent monooxygenase [Hymenobacter sp. DG25A]
MNIPLPDRPVLVVGAGPTGLMLALELVRHGIAPRIIDARPGPSPLSRALVVHARTLELLDRHGLAEAFGRQGQLVAGLNLRIRGRVVAHVPLGRIGATLSPFPYLLIVSQDQTERLLREALAAQGIQVEWHTELTSLQINPPPEEGVTVQLHQETQPETAHFRFLAGCDGANSATRRALDIKFPGGTYKQVFFVADTRVSGLTGNHDKERYLQVAVQPEAFYAFFPMQEQRTRIIGVLPDGVAPEAATFEDVRPRLETSEKVKVDEVFWFSTYKVHHRVAASFQQGPVFLAGDAAHVHSPAGGQGMNTGMGDAVNLGWKLAAVLRGASSSALLPTYSLERIPFAQKLVATTDRAFSVATRPSKAANFGRLRILPILLPLLARLPFMRQLVFRTVSQISIAYPDSPLSVGAASHVDAGERLPWQADGRFEALRPAGWHLFTVAEPSTEIKEWASLRELPLTVIRPMPAETPGTVYLLRPDGYLGLVAPQFEETQFTAYADQWGVGKAPFRVLSVGAMR